MSSDDDVVEDKKMAGIEQEGRGRKRKREASCSDSDEDMRSDVEDITAVEALSKIPSRSYTPAQRTISAQKKLRERSQSRREGSVPARLSYKPVPEEQVRLAKKINKKVFGRGLHVHEADRHISVKRPKHLFAGKMGNGTSRSR